MILVSNDINKDNKITLSVYFFFFLITILAKKKEMHLSNWAKTFVNMIISNKTFTYKPLATKGSSSFSFFIQCHRNLYPNHLQCEDENGKKHYCCVMDRSGFIVEDDKEGEEDEKVKSSSSYWISSSSSSFSMMPIMAIKLAPENVSFLLHLFSLSDKHLIFHRFCHHHFYPHQNSAHHLLYPLFFKGLSLSPPFPPLPPTPPPTNASIQ